MKYSRFLEGNIDFSGSKKCDVARCQDNGYIFFIIRPHVFQNVIGANRSQLTITYCNPEIFRCFNFCGLCSPT
jgi:hypothetical protein